MIKSPLRILLVEDNEADILITRRSISRLVENPRIEVVDDLESFKNKLINFIPDVIISDYNLPTCTGMEILQLSQEKSEGIAFIFLTGTMHDEELAANTILSGASGYILKKNMSRLEEKLNPLLKQVAFRLGEKQEVRERLRENKIVINQINDYLDSLKADSNEQKENIGKIRSSIKDFNFWKNDDDRKT
jgi:response regulator RpfG family c-di-GMP phosphodiesterase